MAGIVDEDVNLATGECFSGGVDNVIAKGERAGIALNSNSLDAELFDLDKALFGSSLVRVVMDYNLRVETCVRTLEVGLGIHVVRETGFIHQHRLLQERMR